MFTIGIDIGTSGTKSVLFAENGAVVASASAEYPLYQPKAGWAEQDPADWWNAVCQTVSELFARSGASTDEVAGVGLSGQMHGLVMLDGNGKVLRRSIIWCDQRTAEECRELTERVGAERLVEITANPAMTGFTASKILWVKNHEPEIYGRCAHILLPKDYVRYMLTGEFAAEMSDASGMQLLDVPNRCWSDEVCEKLGIDRSLLAPVFESLEVTGRVSRSASAKTGLRVGTAVVGGAGDQAAGGIGNGIVREGVVSATLGTSGVVFAHTNRLLLDPAGRVHTLCHAVPGCWHVMGVTQAAGLSLKWFRDSFCAAEIQTAAAMGTDPYVLMDKEAALAAPGCGGLIYLPYLMGERTPHLDPDARGVFFGLSALHTRRDMLRSVMEGVGYSLRDCLEIISSLGVNVGEVRASGGGGRSPFWRQICADMFGREVVTTRSSEGPALGVAILAGTAAGIYSSVEQGCDICVARASSQASVPETAAVYNKYYPLYRQLYASLKGCYKLI